ncbi:MAG: hypothetical protein MUF18_07845 [Fimbriiglobus sp.]|nr:hypothetical protein [Fimbriiglobus sp.]
MLDTPRTPIDAELSLAALRYAAGEMPPPEAEQFEARLGDDQVAREALAEAVRLSAAASGLPVPTPDHQIRAGAIDQLFPTWASRLFPSRRYRGHPLAWAGLGGGVAAVVALAVGLTGWREPSSAVTSIRAIPPAVVALEVADVDVPHTAAERPTGPTLNPMGMEKRGAEPLDTACPLPVAVPSVKVVPVTMPKPVEPAVAEGGDEPNPMGEPKTGPITSNL